MIIICCGLTKLQAQEINFNDSWKFFNAEVNLFIL